MDFVRSESSDEERDNNYIKYVFFREFETTASQINLKLVGAKVPIIFGFNVWPELLSTERIASADSGLIEV